jgi:hypothetical protein
MGVSDYGQPADPLASPSLSAWAASVADALDEARREYHYVKAPPVPDVPADTWTPVASLTAPGLPAGVYEIGWSITWRLDSTVQSAMFRADYNGTQLQYAAEPQDRSNVVPWVYLFPWVHPGGTYTLAFDVMKEGGLDVMSIDYCDLWVKQVS